jgi:hypothetical protein
MDSKPFRFINSNWYKDGGGSMLGTRLRVDV